MSVCHCNITLLVLILCFAGLHDFTLHSIRTTEKVSTAKLMTCFNPLKVWNLTNCRLKTNHIGHTGYLNCVTVSPDGSLCASGGKDGMAMLWDLNEGKHLYTLDGGDILHALCFSPNRYWLCAAAGPSIKVWVSSIGLQKKNR